MIEETTETIKYYADLANDDATVFSIQWLITDENDVPLTGDVTEVHFRIELTDKTRLLGLTSPERITYHPETGAIEGAVRNSDVPFLQNHTDYRFHCFIVLDGATEDVAFGPLNVERVF